MRPSLRSMTCCCSTLRALFLSLTLGPLSAIAFVFTNTSPTQCDPFTVNWTGGQPPFTLVMVPPGKRLVNITIPSTAFTNNVGQFTLPQLPLGENQSVLFTISDAVGLSSGGITSLLTVGPSQSNAQCTIISSTPDFFFSLDGPLQECEPYPFSSYPNAVQPVTIFGFVPQGQSFTLNPPIGDTFTWTNTLVAGTSVSFSMTDSQGRSGGSSDMRVVQLSNNTSCITTSSSGLIGTTLTPTVNNLAPVSPTTPTSSTSGATRSGPTVTTTVTSGEPKKPNSVAAIAGAAAGGVAIVALLIAFLFYLRRRRKNRERNDPFTTIGLTGLLSEPPRFGDGSSSPDIIVPFNIHPGYSSMDYKPSSRESSSYRETSSSFLYAPLRHNEPSLRDRNAVQRIVVHTDIAEAPTEEPLELPPRYSERRTPIPGLLSSTTSTSPNVTTSVPRKS